MGYKFEIWMRWGFLAAVVAVLGLSFYGSRFYQAVNSDNVGRHARRNPCKIQLSRDIEHTSSIGIPALETMARSARTLEAAGRMAYEACNRDSSLTAVYLRQNCGDDGRRQLSRTVFCK